MVETHSFEQDCEMCRVLRHHTINAGNLYIYNAEDRAIRAYLLPIDIKLPFELS